MSPDLPSGIFAERVVKPGAISSNQQAGSFQTLKQNLAQPIFALDFNPQTPGVHPSIEFGALDHSRANGALSRVPIDGTQGYWNATGIVFEINQKRVVTQNGALLRGNMLFDSEGSTLIDVPPTVAKAYYADVPNSHYTSNGYWNFPCNSQVPDLKLYMGNGTAIYRASLINSGYSPNDTDCSFHLFLMILLLADEYIEACTGRLGNTTNEDTTMGNLGGPFFESHYVVFNQTDGAPSVLYAPYL